MKAKPNALQEFERPRSVDCAVILGFLNIVLYIAYSIWAIYFSEAGRQNSALNQARVAHLMMIVPFTIFSVSFFYASTLYQISQGRNWARILLIGVIAVNVVSYLVNDWHHFRVWNLDCALRGGQTSIDIAVIVFLTCKPTNLWYRQLA